MLDELGGAARSTNVPLGFVPRLLADQWNYSIILKDMFDPCGGSVFSDNDGTVYQGVPSRRDPDAPSLTTPRRIVQPASAAT
jgi:hypothetical protein